VGFVHPLFVFGSIFEKNVTLAADIQTHKTGDSEKNTGMLLIASSMNPESEEWVVTSKLIVV
jgi:hypothetical protein